MSSSDVTERRFIVFLQLVVSSAIWRPSSSVRTAGLGAEIELATAKRAKEEPRGDRSEAEIMESRRQPLKRLCSDAGSASPRKKRFGLSEDRENREPEESERGTGGDWSSLLRFTEQEIKPDTPAIPSVRSRIQRLQEVGMRGKSPDVGEEDRVVSRAEQEKGLAAGSDLISEDADSLSEGGSSVCWVPDGDNHGGAEERLLPLAQSTLAPRRPLPSMDDTPPSLETASRLRKEREEEIAMVCSVVDHSNPWRVASMRQKKRRLEERTTQSLNREKRRRRVRTGRGHVKMRPRTESDSSGSEVMELSVDGSEASLDLSQERCVSSLEVRLRRRRDHGSVPPEEPPCLSDSGSLLPVEPPCLCDSVDEGKPACGGDAGDARRLTMNSSEIIDRIFEGVLDVSEASEDLDLELPPVSILSPLTKSADLQAALSPLQSSVVSSLPELLAEDSVTSTEEEAHLPYSIDAYRTLRKTLQATPRAQLCTPSASHRWEEPAAPSAPCDLKERIKALNKEVTSLQRIMEQACSALSCCVDVEHGKGSRQEAEAERLLLVSAEKKKALLKYLNQLREHSGGSPPHQSREPRPCRGSVTISGIQLPLKVDYVCTTFRDSGTPSHYFLLLIRYGSHDVVATPLASAADAQTGDTIIFPTSVTLNDAEADFTIEIEVYSLAQSASALTIEKRKSMKPKITPKKLLSARKASLNSPACSPAGGAALRSSSFLLVGSLTLSLDSLGKLKFPLEKMKLEGKVGRLLGNHFQDKVPFLSPLEGSLHLKMQCQSHSAVQRSAFLTMFEDVGGLGAWHRRWCVLSRNTLSFWDYPDQEAFKEPLRRINLVNCTSGRIQAVPRETCARPHTMELLTMRPQQEDDTETLVTQCRNTLCFTKHWLSAETKEEKAQWMESLNQVLLDLRTWGATAAKVTQS